MGLGAAAPLFGHCAPLSTAPCCAAPAAAALCASAARLAARRVSRGPTRAVVLPCSQVHFDSHFNSDDELDELWTRLQTRYVGNGAAENASKSHSSPEHEDPGGNAAGRDGAGQ